LGALQFWEKRGFEGAAPSVSPTHIVKENGVIRSLVIDSLMEEMT
jgi:hypothetical protein